MKKLLSLILALAMMLSFASIVVSAEEIPNEEIPSMVDSLPEGASQELIAFAQTIDDFIADVTDIIASVDDVDENYDIIANGPSDKMIDAIAAILNKSKTGLKTLGEKYAALSQDDLIMMFEDQETADLMKAEMDAFFGSLDEVNKVLIDPIIAMTANKAQFKSDVKVILQIIDLVPQLYSYDESEDDFGDIGDIGDFDFPDVGFSFSGLKNIMALEDEDDITLEDELSSIFEGIFDLSSYFEDNKVTADQYEILKQIKALLPQLSDTMTGFMKSFGADVAVLEEQVNTYIATYDAANKTAPTTKPATPSTKPEDDNNPGTGASAPIGIAAVAMMVAAALVVTKKK